MAHNLTQAFRGVNGFTAVVNHFGGLMAESEEMAVNRPDAPSMKNANGLAPAPPPSLAHSPQSTS